MATEHKRLHVGGLFDYVTEEELKQRIGKYGAVSSVEIIVRRDSAGKPMKTFAYVDISINDAEYKKCVRAFDGCKWKGTVLSIQQAKQSFLNKLQTERKDEKEKLEKLEAKSSEKLHEKVRIQMEKGELPVESSEGNSTWVVGKSGKVLPVVNIRRKDKKKVVTVDPTEYEEGMKNLDNERDDVKLSRKNVTNLTWEMAEEPSENQKRRMGEFPAYTPPKRKKRTLDLSAYSKRNNNDDGFEVVSGSGPRGQGQGSRTFASSGYNSDSSEDGAVVKSSSSSLPDIVKSTGLAPKRRYDSSDSESDNNTVRSSKKIEPAAKKTKSPSLKIGFPTMERKNEKWKVPVSVGDSDSGSESDTPMASFQKKSKMEHKSENVTSAQNHKVADENLQAKTVKGENAKPTKSGTKTRKERRLEEKKKKTCGKLPGFGGRAMVDSVTSLPVVREVEPELNLEGVKYGADILRELFSEEEGKGRGRLKGKNVQGAIDNLLGLQGGLELGSVQSGKSYGSDTGDSGDESENDDSDGENNAEYENSAFFRRDSSEESEDESSTEDDSTDDSSNDSDSESSSEGDENSAKPKCITKDKVSIVQSSDSSGDGADSDTETSEDDEASSNNESSPKGPSVLKITKNDDSEESDDDDDDSDQSDNSDDDDDDDESDDDDSTDDDSSDDGNINKEDKSVTKDAGKLKSPKPNKEIDNAVLTKHNAASKNVPDKSDLNKKAEKELSASKPTPQALTPGNRNTPKKSVKTSGSALSEFSSGFTENSQLSGDDDNNENYDSEEDLLDMIAGGKMGKVKEYEKKALTPGKQGKRVKSTTKVKDELKVTEKAKVTKETNLNLDAKKTKSAKTESKVEKDQKTLKSETGTKDVKTKSKDKKKESEKPKTKEQKHTADNERRVESLRQRELEVKSQKAAIQTALKSLDSSGTSSKKIVFDSDSDEEVQPAIQTQPAKEARPAVNKVTAPESSSSESDETSSSEDESDEDSKDEMASESEDETGDGTETKTAGALFADSDLDSEGSEDNDEDRFRMRPEYEGETGRKLLSMQRRFKGDERFKLDARFVDDDVIDEEETKSAAPADSLEVEAGGISEKQKSLQILGEVLGSTRVAQPETRKMFKDVSALHYDPTREDHAQFEIKPTTTEEPKKKKKKKKDKDAEEETAEDLPEVTGDKFYEVDPGFSAMLASKKQGEEEGTASRDEQEPITDQGGSSTQKPFSLLSMFGKAEEPKEKNVEEAEDGVYQYEKPESRREHFGGLGLHDNDDDNNGAESDGEENKDEAVEMKDNLHSENSGKAKSTVNRFFFTENDPRIADGASWFCRPEDTEELHAQWSETRRDLVDAFRLKRKRRLQKSAAALKLKKRTFRAKKYAR